MSLRKIWIFELSKAKSTMMEIMIKRPAKLLEVRLGLAEETAPVSS